MLGLFLAAVVCQFDEIEHAFSTPAPASPIEIAINDLAFERAIEEFVARSDARSNPPESYRTLIATMGDVRWKVRDEATRAMAAACAGDSGARRWLWWGRMNPDPEIRHRSNAIIRRLCPCPACHGSGASKDWSEYPCDDCEGVGTSWPISAFDDRNRPAKIDRPW